MCFELKYQYKRRKTVTPGGAIEILEILGKEESLRRMQEAIKKLENK